ncbi:Fanconi anemia group D2 protein [Zancudomyces culisetae]|uniref:Fanconi anemia group D2 protein n=1 Tax=Zancudomyces culisetae TaxID=1213189 RepID=A0A1R1PNM0_ZANCU|nr:Fanconi anemia group D2 protein [Zancudomyces culisetae]|eukprot:OMH82503.1 Fanconi anemia group D2 protein [Zancudomyces culisetae]
MALDFINLLDSFGIKVISETETETEPENTHDTNVYNNQQNNNKKNHSIKLLGNLTTTINKIRSSISTNKSQQSTLVSLFRDFTSSTQENLELVIDQIEVSSEHNELDQSVLYPGYLNKINIFKILTTIEDIQPDILEVFLEKIPEYADFEGWIEYIVDGQRLCSKYIEILEIVPPNIQKEMLSILAELINDSEHDTVSIQLVTMLENNESSELILPILDALSSITCNSDGGGNGGSGSGSGSGILRTAQNIVMDKILRAARPIDIPALIGFLITSCTDIRERERDISTERVVRSIRTGICGVFVNTNTNGHISESQKQMPELELESELEQEKEMIIESIKKGISNNKSVPKQWIKLVLNEPDIQNKLDKIDLIAMIVIYGSNHRANKKAAGRAIQHIIDKYHNNRSVSISVLADSVGSKVCQVLCKEIMELSSKSILKDTVWLERVFERGGEYEKQQIVVLITSLIGNGGSSSSGSISSSVSSSVSSISSSSSNGGGGEKSVQVLQVRFATQLLFNLAIQQPVSLCRYAQIIKAMLDYIDNMATNQTQTQTQTQNQLDLQGHKSKPRQKGVIPGNKNNNNSNNNRMNEFYNVTMDENAVNNMRRVFEALAILRQHNEAFGEEMQIYIRKQLVSSSAVYNRAGILGAVSMIKYLSISQLPGSHLLSLSSSSYFPATSSLAPTTANIANKNKHIREAVDILQGLIDAGRHRSYRYLTMAYDELANMISSVTNEHNANSNSNSNSNANANDEGSDGDGDGMDPANKRVVLWLNENVASQFAEAFLAEKPDSDNSENCNNNGGSGSDSGIGSGDRGGENEDVEEISFEISPDSNVIIDLNKLLSNPNAIQEALVMGSGQQPQSQFQSQPQTDSKGFENTRTLKHQNNQNNQINQQHPIICMCSLFNLMQSCERSLNGDLSEIDAVLTCGLRYDHSDSTSLFIVASWFRELINAFIEEPFTLSSNSNTHQNGRSHSQNMDSDDQSFVLGGYLVSRLNQLAIVESAFLSASSRSGRNGYSSSKSLSTSLNHPAFDGKKRLNVKAFSFLLDDRLDQLGVNLLVNELSSLFLSPVALNTLLTFENDKGDTVGIDHDQIISGLVYQFINIQNMQKQVASTNTNTKTNKDIGCGGNTLVIILDLLIRMFRLDDVIKDTIVTTFTSIYAQNISNDSGNQKESSVDRVAKFFDIFTTSVIPKFKDAINVNGRNTSSQAIITSIVLLNEVSTHYNSTHSRNGNHLYSNRKLLDGFSIQTGKLARRVLRDPTLKISFNSLTLPNFNVDKRSGLSNTSKNDLELLLSLYFDNHANLTTSVQSILGFTEHSLSLFPNNNDDQQSGCESDLGLELELELEPGVGFGHLLTDSSIQIVFNTLLTCLHKCLVLLVSTSQRRSSSISSTFSTKASISGKSLHNNYDNQNENDENDENDDGDGDGDGEDDDQRLLSNLQLIFKTFHAILLQSRSLSAYDNVLYYTLKQSYPILQTIAKSILPFNIAYLFANDKTRHSLFFGTETNSRDTSHSILYFLQKSTRTLHIICNHVKANKPNSRLSSGSKSKSKSKSTSKSKSKPSSSSKSCTSFVPNVKKTLELIVLKVKEIVGMNNDFEMFELGSLKTRAINGDFVSSQFPKDEPSSEGEESINSLSQNSAIDSGNNSENGEDDIDDDDDNDSYSRKKARRY